MSDWTTNIQWKGTVLCMDFNCPKCEKLSHFDGCFAYHIECPHCRALWKMPTDVPIEEVMPGSEPGITGEPFEEED